MKIFTVAFLLGIVSFSAIAQEIPRTFGDVTSEELTMKEYAPDTSAVAVVLFDKGYSLLDGSSTSYLTYKRHVRIKIFKKDESGEWANVKFVLRKGSLSDIKGITYNLEHGSMVTTELKEDAVFKTRHSKGLDEVNFTLPDIKEGSIIEYSFEFKGTGFPGWAFQRTIPTVWSEYIVNCPFQLKSLLNFTLRGKIPLTKTETKDHETRWIMANIPAFKPEPLMPNQWEYVSSLDFSTTGTTWYDLNDGLWKNQNFGRIFEGSPFLNEVVADVTKGIRDPIDKIVAIQRYLKDNLPWDGTEDMYAEHLRDVFKQKGGTAADINIALGCMLRKAGVKVEMVLISTRGNGFVRTDVATLQQFNYVICLVTIGDTEIFLDATEKYLPWNVLPERCLNGLGFVVSEKVYRWVDTNTKIKNKSALSGNLILSSSGQLTGKLTYTSDGYAAFKTRDKFQRKGKISYLEDFGKDHAWQLVSSHFKNVDNTEEPLEELYDVVIDEHGLVAGDMLYINPFVSFRMMENPFKEEIRNFPIDFVVKSEHVYLITIIIPEDFKIDEAPPTKNIQLPNNAGRFTYTVSQLGNKVTVVSNIQINNRIFMPEQYVNLREFYNIIVAKHAEQIVLKKL